MQHSACVCTCMYVDCQPLDLRVQLGCALDLVGFVVAKPDEVVLTNKAL